MDDVTPRHSHTRAFQVIVWGATGFTGRLVCEHIASDYQASYNTRQPWMNLRMTSFPSQMADTEAFVPC